MSFSSVLIRSTHLVTNAAWFGGSLMGAVGLNRASREGDDRQERAQVAGTGWESWGPVQGASVGLHLLSGLGILADNPRRTILHSPTRSAVVLKTALTAAALGTTVAAWKLGEQVGETEGEEGTPSERSEREKARKAHQQLSWLQWGTPALTGSLLVLDAYLGEQQRGPAGLLDRR